MPKDYSEQADKCELVQKSENKNEGNPGEIGIRVLKHDCIFNGFNYEHSPCVNMLIMNCMENI